MTRRIAYADPPYPGCAHLYRDHPDYAGEVDHNELIERLERDYDAWALHTNSTTLARVLATCPDGVRIMAWVKPFASFKPNVPVAYAWEPVIVKGARTRIDRNEPTTRDWIAEPITLRRGLTGAKPDAVVRWLLRVLDVQPGDDVHDLYPGTGAVARAIAAYQATPTLWTAR